MGANFTQAVDEFRHEALMYAGMADFLAGTVPFIRGGLEAGEPVLVVESAGKIALLRSELGSDARSVVFADMADVGANPARIIPAWRDFVQKNGAEGRRLRGIGEPIWNGRTPLELIECQRHESLLNTAFASGDPWWLLCPYDTAAMDPAVIDEARRSHPYVTDGTSFHRSNDYRGLDACAAPFEVPLPEPGSGVQGLAFNAFNLVEVRGLAGRFAADAGLAPSRAANFVLAANEIATNSVLHGGGKGSFRIWREAGAISCEVRDAGHISNPLVDRELPAADVAGSRGLWLGNHLCDLVQIRRVPGGTAVRLHMWLKPTRQTGNHDGYGSDSITLD
jgi:anti-sigma regulatory factor (Ser/Thr protein kinase)